VYHWVMMAKEMNPNLREGYNILVSFCERYLVLDIEVTMRMSVCYFIFQEN